MLNSSGLVGRQRSETGELSRRLLEPIGYIPPAEAEARFYAQSHELAMVA